MPNLCGERVAIPDTRQPGRHRRCREGNRCPKPGAGGPHILIVRQSPPKRDASRGRGWAPRISRRPGCVFWKEVVEVMETLNQVLLIVHYLGLTLGFSVGITNVVVSVVNARTAPEMQPVLRPIPPIMSRIGEVGLALLWATGITLIYTRWNGWEMLPALFKVKLGAVIVLTLAVGIIAHLGRRIKRGDTGAAKNIENFGKLASLSALVALVFAVLAFG